jgi:hypothetical protein
MLQRRQSRPPSNGGSLQHHGRRQLHHALRLQRLLRRLQRPRRPLPLPPSLRDLHGLRDRRPGSCERDDNLHLPQRHQLHRRHVAANLRFRARRRPSLQALDRQSQPQKRLAAERSGRSNPLRHPDRPDRPRQLRRLPSNHLPRHARASFHLRALDPLPSLASSVRRSFTTVCVVVGPRGSAGECCGLGVWVLPHVFRGHSAGVPCYGGEFQLESGYVFGGDGICDGLLLGCCEEGLSGACGCLSECLYLNVVGWVWRAVVQCLSCEGLWRMEPETSIAARTHRKTV